MSRGADYLDPKYRKKNPERSLFWERFDRLPVEAKQLIWDSPDEPTPDMLLVCEELVGELLPAEEPRLNAKQRAWLERQKAKEDRFLQRKLRNAERYEAFLRANPEVARLHKELYEGMTREQIRVVRFTNEKRAADEKARRDALYAKVLGEKPPRVNVKVVHRYND